MSSRPAPSSTGPSKARSFVFLCVVTAALHAAYSAVRVLVSYRALDLGGDAVAIGVITALFALLPLFVALQVGRAVDRDRAGTFLQAGLVLTAVAVGVITVSGNLVWLGVGNVLLGFGQILAMVAAQGFVPVLAEPNSLDQRFAAWTLSVSIGQTIGLPVAGLVSAWGGGAREEATTRALVALLVLLVLSAPFAFLLRNPSTTVREGEEGPQSLATMLVIPGMGPAVLSSLAVLTSMDLVAAYLPVLGEEHGFTVLLVTILIAVRTGSSVLSRAFLPLLLRHVTRARLLVSATLCSGVPMALLPFTSSPVVMGALLAVAGFFWGIGQPLTMSWVVGLVTDRNRASALGLRLTGNRIGQFIVPLGASAAAGAAGVGSVFLANGALLLGSAFVTWSSLRGRLSSSSE